MTDSVSSCQTSAGAVRRAAIGDRDTRLREALKRCASMLNSARLIMLDPVARELAGEAIAEARAALAPAGPTDADRYRWLRKQFLAADFMWGEPPTPVLVFRWPANTGVGVDLDANIYAAILDAEKP